MQNWHVIRKQTYFPMRYDASDGDREGEQKERLTSLFERQISLGLFT